MELIIIMAIVTFMYVYLTKDRSGDKDQLRVVGSKPIEKMDVQLSGTFSTVNWDKAFSMVGCQSIMAATSSAILSANGKHEEASGVVGAVWGGVPQVFEYAFRNLPGNALLSPHAPPLMLHMPSIAGLMVICRAILVVVP